MSNSVDDAQEIESLLLTDDGTVGTALISGQIDPSVIGFVAPISSHYYNLITAQVWKKTGSSDVNWELQITDGSGGSGSGSSLYDDVLEYGFEEDDDDDDEEDDDDGDDEDDDGESNKFMDNAGTQKTSLYSAPLAPKAGNVIAISISTKKKPTNNFFVQVITNAVKGGSGAFSGGSQIGTNLEKPTGQLDIVIQNLTGFTFAANDRIQAYIKKGTLGNKTAEEPLVRLFIKYI